MILKFKHLPVALVSLAVPLAMTVTAGKVLAQSAPKQLVRQQPAQSRSTSAATSRVAPGGNTRVRLAQAEPKSEPKPDSEGMKKGEKLYGEGNLEAAAAQYREVIRGEPDNAKAHQRLGAVLAGLATDPRSKSHDDYETAILEEKQAIKLDPKNFLPHVILGQVYANQNKNEEAIKEFQQACDLKPTSFRSHLDLGKMYMMVNRLDDAVRVFRQATKIKPEDATPYVNMGVALQAKGDFKAAIDTSKKGISLLENSKTASNQVVSTAYINLGNIYADAGQNDGALEAYQHALKVEKGHPFAQSGVGWMLARKGDVQEAIKIQRKVLKYNPNLTFVRARLAAALDQQGKPEEAQKEFEQCLKAQIPDPIAMFEYGQFLQKAGKKDKAKTLFQQALKAQPNYKPAKEALARLENGNSQTK